MARAHFVKKARKDNSVVKKGESYYWWKFRYGGKHLSKTAPRASQLTQSEFLGQVYDLQDRISELTVDSSAENGIEDLKGEVQSIADDIRSLGEEQSDKIYNMPDSLQESDTGQLLQDRADNCEQWASDLDGIDLEVEKESDESDDDFQDRCEDLLSEIQGCEYQGE